MIFLIIIHYADCIIFIFFFRPHMVENVYITEDILNSDSTFFFVLEGYGGAR